VTKRIHRHDSYLLFHQTLLLALLRYSIRHCHSPYCVIPSDSVTRLIALFHQTVSLALLRYSIRQCHSPYCVIPSDSVTRLIALFHQTLSLALLRLSDRTLISHPCCSNVFSDKKVRIKIFCYTAGMLSRKLPLLVTYPRAVFLNISHLPKCLYVTCS
jgi:hypothetical protein